MTIIPINFSDTNIGIVDNNSNIREVEVVGHNLI